MKFKTIMLLGVAIACGLVAMLGVQQVLSSPTDAPEETEKKTVEVLYATQDIEPFTSLDESNIDFKTVPADSAPEGAVKSRSEFENHTLKYGTVKGKVIVQAELTDKNHSPSDEIPDGMRIVSVKVDKTKTHSGLLRPGDCVDIVLTYKSKKSGFLDVQRTLTILQNVQVFATDSVLKRHAKDKDTKEINAKNISLIVTPSHANLLMQAENMGVLTLSLRKQNQPLAENIKSYNEDWFNKLNSGSSASPEHVGKSDKKPETVADGKSFQTNRSRFKDFLTEDPTQKETNLAKTESKKRSAKRTWRLTIFEGSTARVVEIELPEEPQKKNRPAAKGAEKPTQPLPSKGKQQAV